MKGRGGQLGSCGWVGETTATYLWSMQAKQALRQDLRGDNGAAAAEAGQAEVAGSSLATGLIRIQQARSCMLSPQALRQELWFNKGAAPPRL